MAEDSPIATRLQMLVIGAATTVLTTVGSYVTSHWGGVTSEQLSLAKQEITASVNKVEMKVASESTDLKRYVDEKVASAEERLRPKPPKRKAKSEQ